MLFNEIVMAAAQKSGGGLADYITLRTGFSSVLTPAGYTKVTVEAIGTGGEGFGSATAGLRAGGGGAQYAISDANLAVVPGVTEVYYSAPGATTGADAWANVAANVAPTLSSTGCLAKGGTNASSGVAGLGNQAGSIGATTRNGGNGTTGSSGVGGGGAGATTAGSGQTAGTDTTGLSVPVMGDGTGGASGGGLGVIPGGGGGSSATGGVTPNGGASYVRMRFSA